VTVLPRVFFETYPFFYTVVLFIAVGFMDSWISCFGSEFTTSQKEFVETVARKSFDSCCYSDQLLLRKSRIATSRQPVSTP